MRKILKLELKDFRCIPDSLRVDPTVNKAVEEINVRMVDLFNHYYQDTFKEYVPQPNPLTALYMPLFMSQAELRFAGDGLGTHKEVKIGEYNKFGKAFCRWFLHEHCDMAYFTHVDDVLNKSFIPGYDLKLERAEEGDTPDYFCAKNTRKVSFAEAKGSSKAIKFTHKKFTNWREQFERVKVLDRVGRSYSLKGYIIATHLACENDKPSVRSTLLAEDPHSSGDTPIENAQDFVVGLGTMIIYNHYASILDKLRQPLLAAALRSGFTLQGEVNINYFIWRCLVPPAQDVEYIGGYFPPANQPFNTLSELQRIWHWWSPSFAPMNLAAEKHVFFGLELKKFETLLESIRKGYRLDIGIEQSDIAIKRNEAPPDMSLLRDGSVFAPLDYFVLSGQSTSLL